MAQQEKLEDRLKKLGNLEATLGLFLECCRLGVGTEATEEMNNMTLEDIAKAASNPVVFASQVAKRHGKVH